jgi:hypothetical protein
MPLPPPVTQTTLPSSRPTRSSPADSGEPEAIVSPPVRRGFL